MNKLIIIKFKSISDHDYIGELELELDNIWFVNIKYLPKNIHKNDITLGFSNILEHTKFINDYSNLKEYLIDNLKNVQVSNIDLLNNSNSSSEYLKISDYYRGQKLCFLISISNENRSKYKFSIYIQEKFFEVSYISNSEEIKYYIENQILNKIFRGDI